MLLYLVRHAYAGQRGDPQYPDDNLRPLTKKGRKRFRRLVKKLARRGFSPAVIATSPLLRCRQTADVIAKRLRLADHVVEMPALAPGSRLDPLVEWTSQQGLNPVAWVGHSPDIEQLAAQLIGAREGAVVFAKGAIAAIEFADGLVPGQGELAWLASPKMLGC
jgi:phosphohistidine phosphatase